MKKMYSTYNKVKDVFKKPILKWSCCNWYKSSTLPIWRRGNGIKFGKYNEYDSKWDYARFISAEWNDVGKNNHPIISKIFKPYYQMPKWFAFYIFHRDVMWKSKYDKPIYMYPPQFTIVFFGWSLNFWLINPTGDINNDYDYWETMLEYIDVKENPEDYYGNIKELPKIPEYFRK